MANVALTTSNIPATVCGGQWDHLPLPDGSTIGKTADTQILRKIFHRMGIESAHRDGRETLCARYAALLREIGGAASDKAIMEFLDKYKESSLAQN
jgi:hypothetical protein